MIWAMTGPDGEGEYLIFDEDSYYAPEVIATVHTFKNDEHSASAAARLIAAAPELLAVCLVCHDAIKDRVGWGDLADEVEAAILKAMEGGPWR